MYKILLELITNKNGQGIVEYGLIISLVIIASIGALKLFGIEMGNLFDFILLKTSEVM